MLAADPTEYERFSYDEKGQNLTLDEAIKVASESRREDSANFYRVRVSSPESSTFRVERVSAASAYADFVSRAMKSAVRHARVARRK